MAYLTVKNSTATEVTVNVKPYGYSTPTDAYTYRLLVNEVSTQSDANMGLYTFYFQIKTKGSGGWGFTSWTMSSATFTFTINNSNWGTNDTNNYNMSGIRNSKTVTVDSTSYTTIGTMANVALPHNDDGSLEITFTVNYGGSSADYLPTNTTISGTFVATTLTPTTDSNTYIRSLTIPSGDICNLEDADDAYVAGTHTIYSGANATVVLPGFISLNSTGFYVTVPTPKSLRNVSTFTLSSFSQLYFRIVSGGTPYAVSTAMTNLSSLPDTVTCTITKGNDRALQLVFTNVVSGTNTSYKTTSGGSTAVTNNRPIAVVFGTLAITMS